MTTVVGAAEGTCPVPGQIIDRALELSWEEFDQGRDSPYAFRSLAEKACYGEAAELILLYIDRKSGLRDDYRRLSRFHAGQLFATAERTEEAIALIETTYDRNTRADKPIDWDTYVDGVLAFLKRDRQRLMKSHAELERLGEKNLTNARVLRAFERCFESKYAIAVQDGC